MGGWAGGLRGRREAGGGNNNPQQAASQCTGKTASSPLQAWGHVCRCVCLITALHLIHNSHGGREIRAATLVSTQKEQIWAAMQIARKVPSFEKKKKRKKNVGGGAFALKGTVHPKKFRRLAFFIIFLK